MRQTSVLFVKSLTKAAIQATEREVHITVPWGKLTALTWGKATNPPVFLCHGRLDSCSSFRRLVHHLPDQYFYVSVDLPGNGRSDPLPKSTRYMMLDFVPSLARIREHFKWDQFIYVGHSLGAAIGKYYNMIYPGYMTKVVEIDPEPAYSTPFMGVDFRAWYLFAYEQFYKDFAKNSAGVETAPKYSYEEIKRIIMKARGLDEDAVDDILERCLVPTEDGLYRATFDQRMKTMVHMPFSAEQYKDLYTASTTPTLAIFAQDTVDRGVYKALPFSMDENEWPNRNYKSVLLEGGHDLYLQKTEAVAKLIVDFIRKQ